MSAIRKTDYLPDAATLDLWRVAESGDVNSLESLLPRLRDINARNEHGVTALMRAAQYGHVKMVRALLEQNGIRSFVEGGDFAVIPSSFSQEVVVMVDERDLPRAVEIYNAYFDADATAPASENQTDSE